MAGTLGKIAKDAWRVTYMHKTKTEIESIYQENPIIRGLIASISIAKPEVCILDSIIMAKLSNIQHNRIKVFFDELGNGDIELTSETIETNEFLHCYTMTVKAFLNTYRVEKIRLLARLLKGYFVNSDFDKIDEYEEMLGIIDEMSYREIMILLKIYDIENETTFIDSDKNDDSIRRRRAWELALPIICDTFKVSENEMIAMLNRLYRTGCYVSTAGFWEHTSGKGNTSPLFDKLVKVVLRNKI